MTDFNQTAFGVTTSDDCRNGIEMLKEAGGDFKIDMKQCSYPVETTENVGIDDTITKTEYVPIDAWVPTRQDTGAAISDRTVGEGFSVFDNHDAVDLVNLICDEHDLTFRFMAVTNGGAGLAMQVECPDLTEALSIGNDEHRGFLTITTSHDGSASLRVTPTVVRMFCRNVLPLIRKQNAEGRRKGDAFLIRHSRKMEDRIADMVGAYRAALGHMEQTSERLRLLTTKRCTDNEMTELWKRVIAADSPVDEKEIGKRAATQRANKLEAITVLAHDPVNQPVEAAHMGTWFHAIQPLTAYGTRGIKTRNTGSVSGDERRWTSAHQGAGADFTNRALEVALEMAGV